MAFIHRPERKKQMSVSATEKDTSLLLKESTGKCQKQRKWGYTKEKEKKHFTLCYQSIQKYLGKATGFKHIDIAKQLTSSLFLHTLFSSGLIQQPKETVLLPPNSAGHGSSFQHEHQQRLPGALNSWATSAPKQPQHQQKLLLPPDLHGSSAATEVSLLCTPFIISERGTDSWPLRDSITNPCLTSLSDKPGSQPRRPPEHLKCQKEKNELQTGEALQTTPNPDSSP